MFAARSIQRPHYDDRFPVWAGSFDAWRDARLGSWFDPEQLAEPFACLVADVWCVALAGLVTRSSWARFAELVSEAPRESRAVSLTITSQAQQLADYHLAAVAIAEAGRAKFTAAHIEWAGGLAVLLAESCHLVTASGAAPIGWLGWGQPFDSPDVVLPLPCNLLQPHGFDVGDSHGFDRAPRRALVRASLPAEQLEGRGVDALMHRSSVAARAGALAAHWSFDG